MRRVWKKAGKGETTVQGFINNANNTKHAVAAQPATARRRLRRITRRLCRRPTSAAATHADVHAPATHAGCRAAHSFHLTIPPLAPPLSPRTTLATPPPTPPAITHVASAPPSTIAWLLAPPATLSPKPRWAATACSYCRIITCPKVCVLCFIWLLIRREQDTSSVQDFGNYRSTHHFVAASIPGDNLGARRHRLRGRDFIYSKKRSRRRRAATPCSFTPSAKHEYVSRGDCSSDDLDKPDERGGKTVPSCAMVTSP